MKLIYEACFIPCEEKDGYTVMFPDLPGCITEGDSLADAITMAADAASGWLMDELEEGNILPPSTDVDEIHKELGMLVKPIAIRI